MKHIRKYAVLLAGSILLLSAGFVLGSFFPATFRSPQPVQQKPVTEDPVVKKQKLETFFKESSEASTNKDYEKLYSFLNPADKKWLTLEDFIILKKIDDPFSIEYTAHNSSLKDDVGSVEITTVTCLTKACSGNDRIEKKETQEFVYTDGGWYQKPQNEPSKKAIDLAAFLCSYMNAQERKDIAVKYGVRENDLYTVIRIYSIRLENNPEQMAYNEAVAEQIKLDKRSAGSTGNNVTDRLDNIETEQQNRDFWESVCASQGKTYNSMIGAGCI